MMTETPAGAPVAATGTAADLVAELEQLVRAAARRPDLVVQLGHADCAWSFDWKRGVVEINPVDLAAFAPDLCRGLALHEATHAAVTVLQEVLPSGRLAKLMPLLNTLEDIRIEVWMRRRFPGAAAWIRAYNDVLYHAVRETPLPVGRQQQFLRGVLELWWLGTTTPGTLPEVEKALASCAEAISAATACQPPLDDDRPAIMASQRAMWEIVEQRILPTWERLVTMDRRAGIARLVARATAVASRRIGRPGARGPREAIAARLGTDDHGFYTTVWRRVAPQADRLGDALLRMLVPSQRMRWTSGHASGTRLDLLRAVEFDADPGRYRSLWCRPKLPQRRDPAILLLIDRSSSMKDEQKIDHAFEGLVLLVEACRRVGVPTAVWSFADRCRRELDWEQPLDAATRHQLGLLQYACEGGTAMSRALDDVRAAFATRRGDPKLLFVLGDGEPDDTQATQEAAKRLGRDGICTVGLGLGKGTSRLAGFFPASITEIPPALLAHRLGAAVEEALTVTMT
jgi:uncharacterized protein with von Willebrand factor type A (vWA) domain